jgi:hypothetical protein
MLKPCFYDDVMIVRRKKWVNICHSVIAAKSQTYLAVKK